MVANVAYFWQFFRGVFGAFLADLPNKLRVFRDKRQINNLSGTAWLRLVPLGRAELRVGGLGFGGAWCVVRQAGGRTGQMGLGSGAGCEGGHLSHGEPMRPPAFANPSSEAELRKVEGLRRGWKSRKPSGQSPRPARHGNGRFGQSFCDFSRLAGKSVGSGTPKILAISQQKAGKRNFTLK